MTADYTNAAAEPDDDGSPIAARNWPDLQPDVYQGVCGQIVNAIMPHTEADPAAVIVTLLAAVGSMLGRSVYALAGNDLHPARIWPLICGRTSDGAKGTSWSTIRPVIDAADPNFLAGHLEGGIVSGEGLIELVRDESGDDPDDKNYDPGVFDKRLLIVEPEFASVLAKGARQGSSLMQILREAWDGSTLRSAARKSNKLRATDPHITVIGHVTPGEFRAKLTAGEVDGGTVNRLLLILSRRSKELPDGGNLPDDVRDRCAGLIAEALQAARTRTAPMQRTAAATRLWREQYPTLVAPKPDGWFASATARAQAQVLRLSVAYAALDSTQVVDVDHLAAALALWDYAEASARVLFAEVGYEKRSDETEKILAFIAARGKVTRNELCDELFQKHKKSHEVDALLSPLIDAGQVAQETFATGGRPRTFYSMREKREKREKHVTSENGEDFSRFSRTAAGKGSEAKPQANGVTPLFPLFPQGKEEKPSGAPTDKTPGMTPAVDRALAAARAGGRFTADPPCFHCDKPVTGKQKDTLGRHAHIECQRADLEEPAL
jgi:Protein of unknown function (DUF3987)